MALIREGEGSARACLFAGEEEFLLVFVSSARGGRDVLLYREVELLLHRSPSLLFQHSPKGGRRKW